MSIRRKHVTQQQLQKDVEPPGPGQKIVRAVGSRGGNLVEVEYPDGRRTLSLLPARFNKKLWVKRGGYLIVQEGACDGGDKVNAEVVSVLYDGDVKDLKKQPGVWPPEFASVQAEAAAPAVASPGSRDAPDSAEAASCSDSDSDDGLPPLQANNNRQVTEYYESERESDEEPEGPDDASPASQAHLDVAGQQQGLQGQSGLGMQTTVCAGLSDRSLPDT